MIEDIEEKITNVVMLVYIQSKHGIKVLSKTVDEEDVINVLYIPKIDLTVYPTYAGSAPNGDIYKKFFFNIRENEEPVYPELMRDFFNNDWILVDVDAL